MILIAAGSNLPFCGLDSQQIVFRSFLAIGRFARLVSQSPLFDSPAWPDRGHPRFVNAAARVETDLTPAALLAALLAVEAAFGRRRGLANAPRTLDLDLIDYHGQLVGEPEAALRLPHPGHAARDFVLGPIGEIAPEWRSPVTGKTAAEMLAATPQRTARRIA
ncbi:MAG: 2-amino-4-hydroxy-6-hydroxymethyldihydropteridine diphosphokinase [Pseudomonadota bacterium]